MSNTTEKQAEQKMKFEKRVVFILGAGFTKAFLPNAPLIVDDFHGEELREKFQGFPAALAVLDSELNNPDHAKGRINIERLMTRLAEGMPYDFGKGENRELNFLLSEITKVLTRRLTEAKAGETECPECLWLFASHVLENQNHCITFNYDDVLDQALCEARLPFIAEPRWNPEWGYGFPSGLSEELVNNYPLIRPGSRMVLHKLHGSMNWRVPLGARQPFEIKAIHHHEQWYARLSPKTPLESLESLLEPDPVLILPVLTKTGLVEQPVLRVVWESARSVLKDAEKVVFIGYSLSITDIAAGFLFAESLKHLPPDHVIIVDRSTTETKREKREQILRAYRRVFPAISEAQIYVEGACAWISSELTNWLFNSAGEPIAFQAARWVFDRYGNNIGDLRSYDGPLCQEFWYETYRGEIFNGNRLLFKKGKYETEPKRGGQLISHKLTPVLPNSIEPIELPAGWRDLERNDFRTN